MELQGAVISHRFYWVRVLRRSLALGFYVVLLRSSLVSFSRKFRNQDNHHPRRQRAEQSSHTLSDCSVDVLVKESGGYFASFLVKRGAECSQTLECSEILECSEVLAHTRYWNVLFCRQVIHSLAFSLTCVDGNQSD